MKTRKLRYFGGVIKHNCLDKGVIQGTSSETRKTGRPKITRRVSKNLPYVINNNSSSRARKLTC